MSGISFIALFLLRILDLAKVGSEQKIMILKISFIMVGITPFIYTLCKRLSWDTINIEWHDIVMYSAPMRALSAPLSGIPIHWSGYILSIYGLGVCVMLLRLFISYWNAQKQLAKSIPAIIHGQSVLLNDHIQSPFSFGLPSASIYFPSDYEKKWTRRQIQISLAHEKNHLKQNDSLWKCISLVMRALLFFVPWSYFIHQRFALEMEILCDARTRAETRASIKEYGSLLLAMTCVKSNNSIFTNMTDSNLKRRFLAMKSKTIKRPFLTLACCATLLLMGGSTIAMTSGLMEKKTTFDIQSKLYIDGELVSSPRVIAHANQKAVMVISDQVSVKDRQQSLSSHFLKLALTASNNSDKKDNIKINYDIQYQNGLEKMHAKSSIHLVENKESVIKIPNSERQYEMHMLAKIQ